MSDSPIKHWLSINLDDTVSDEKKSFAKARCNKSLYISEQTYYSQSWSGKTTYYRYIFYTPDKKRAYPGIGDCKVQTEITQSYAGYEWLNELLRSRGDIIIYPIKMQGSKWTHNRCLVSDNQGEHREVFLSSLSDLLPFLRELSRSGCWEKFKLQQVLNALNIEAQNVKTSITKYGYSKREYGYQYGAVSDDPTFRKRYFNYDLERLQESFDLIVKQTNAKHLEEEEFKIKYLKEDIDFIAAALKGKKPWRKHILI